MNNRRNNFFEEMLYNMLGADFSNFLNNEDEYQRAVDESLRANQEEGLQKTNRVINISSQRYNSLCDEIRVENKECSICMVEYDLEDMISITNCNHIFHTDCIKEWGRYNAVCAMCREAL